jgi:hypothetical protein
MSSTTLKIFALFFMLIDHIGLFIPGMPVYLHWIGRFSAPIFIFCSTCAYTYTRNKKIYLMRLYIASVVMAIIQCQLHVEYNIFRLFFSMCIVIGLIDLYRNKDENFKRYLRIYLIWQIISIAFCFFLTNVVGISNDYVAYFLPALFGNVLAMGGGLVFLCLGVLIYLTKNNKKVLAIAYIGFCAVYFAVTVRPYLSVFLAKLYCIGLTYLSDTIDVFLSAIVGLSPKNLGGSILFENYQWMMILALPFMLFYNGKRGKNIKYFFYIFYPVHTLVIIQIPVHISR